MVSARRTLWVTGFGGDVRARDLGQEFERFGPIVRCDIPIPKGNSAKFAFIEFEYARDAEDAKYEMNRRRFRGDELEVVFARSDRSLRYEQESKGRDRRNSFDDYDKRDSGRRSRYDQNGSPRPYNSRRRSPSPRYSRRSYSRSPSPEFRRGRKRTRSISPMSPRQQHNNGNAWA